MIASTQRASAETIQFNESELARESVYPIFDQPEAVKKRTVPTSGRVELGAFGGTSLNDPFYDVYPVGITIDYHLSEVHSLGLVGGFAVSQSTKYNKQLRDQFSTTFLDQAPYPKTYGLLEYQFTPYYGKISVTKQSVANLSISGLLGVGMMNQNSENGPVFSAGINERFFFSPNFGLRADLRALFYQQTNAVKITTEKRMITNLVLSVGVLFFIPTL
jgi:outer membrane beta-barrel protein